MNDKDKGLSASDIAWAECGGVIVDEETGQLCKLIKVLDSINNGVIIVCPAQIEIPNTLLFELPKVSVFAVPVIHARMATKKQCDDGGVKFIERTMLWQDMKNAPKDAYILGDYDDNWATVGFFTHLGYWWDGYNERNAPKRWMACAQTTKDE